MVAVAVAVCMPVRGCIVGVGGLNLTLYCCVRRRLLCLPAVLCLPTVPCLLVQLVHGAVSMGLGNVGKMKSGLGNFKHGMSEMGALGNNIKGLDKVDTGPKMAGGVKKHGTVYVLPCPRAPVPPCPLLYALCSVARCCGVVWCGVVWWCGDAQACITSDSRPAPPAMPDPVGYC